MVDDYLTDCETRVGGKKTREYNLWRNMINRCTNSEKDVSYNNCKISEDFKQFSNFKSWCQTQIGFDNQKWHLDKDIIVKGNKVYSPETCCFVPREINNLFTLRGKLRGNTPIGVCKSWKSGMYLSRLMKYGKLIHLGWFSTPEEAFEVYKETKESYVKEVAEKWKDQIDPRVYQALLAWTVNIDD